jgi:hypothetical protein
MVETPNCTMVQLLFADAIEPFPPGWLKRFDETMLERLAIMTVDGELSDTEALESLGLDTS